MSKYKPEGAYKKEVYRLQQYIGKLEAQLAEHEWVSVEDGLPEEGSYYQVLRIENPYPSTRYYVANGVWQSRATITHWKPIHLPEAKPAVDAESEVE